jgi:hypothetical protein
MPTEDDDDPIVAAVVTMAEHGITLDAARAGSEATHSEKALFDAHEPAQIRPER